MSEREVTVLINAKLKQSGQNPFAPLEQAAIKSDAVIAQRLNHVQDKLREINTLGAVGGKVFAKSLGFTEADEGIDRLTNRIKDRLSRPITNVSLNRLLGDVKQLENISEGAFSNVVGGLQRSGQGAFSFARGLALLESGADKDDKAFQKTLETLFKFQAAYDVVTGGFSIFKGLAESASNLQRALLATTAAGEALGAVGGVAGVAAGGAAAAKAGPGIISNTISEAIGSTIGNVADNAILPAFGKLGERIGDKVSANIAKRAMDGPGGVRLTGAAAEAALGIGGGTVAKGAGTGGAVAFGKAAIAQILLAGPLLGSIVAGAFAGAAAILSVEGIISGLKGQRSFFGNLGVIFGEAARLEIDKARLATLKSINEKKGFFRNEAESSAGIREQAEDRLRTGRNNIDAARNTAASLGAGRAARDEASGRFGIGIDAFLNQQSGGIRQALGNREGDEKLREDKDRLTERFKGRAEAEGEAAAARSAAEANLLTASKAEEENQRRIVELEEKKAAIKGPISGISKGTAPGFEDLGFFGAGGLRLKSLFSDSANDEVNRRNKVSAPVGFTTTAGQDKAKIEADISAAMKVQDDLANKRVTAEKEVVGTLKQQKQVQVDNLKAIKETLVEQEKFYRNQANAARGRIESISEQFGDKGEVERNQILAAAQKVKFSGVGSATDEERSLLKGIGLFQEEFKDQALKTAQESGLPELLRTTQLGAKPEAFDRQADELKKEIQTNIETQISLRIDTDAEELAKKTEDILQVFFAKLTVSVESAVARQTEELERKRQEAATNSQTAGK